MPRFAQVAAMDFKSSRVLAGLSLDHCWSNLLWLKSPGLRLQAGGTTTASTPSAWPSMRAFTWLHTAGGGRSGQVRAHMPPTSCTCASRSVRNHVQLHTTVIAPTFTSLRAKSPTCSVGCTGQTERRSGGTPCRGVALPSSHRRQPPARACHHQGSGWKG